VAILHSALSPGERFDEWRRIRSGDADIAVGARSAVFAPFVSLGLVVIDEEHEQSYKQEEMPRYHARDVALWRAGKHEAVVLLGSATPAIESTCLAETGIYRSVLLPERIENRPLPQVNIVDMRDELRRGNRTILSQQLREAIGIRLRRREQIIILLNRRWLCYLCSLSGVWSCSAVYQLSSHPLHTMSRTKASDATIVGLELPVPKLWSRMPEPLSTTFRCRNPTGGGGLEARISRC